MANSTKLSHTYNGTSVNKQPINFLVGYMSIIYIGITPTGSESKTNLYYDLKSSLLGLISD